MTISKMLGFWVPVVLEHCEQETHNAGYNNDVYLYAYLPNGKCLSYFYDGFDGYTSYHIDKREVTYKEFKAAAKAVAKYWSWHYGLKGEKGR